jgi:hypothetical protein
MAWHYKKYSKDPELTKLEIQARTAKIAFGLRRILSLRVSGEDKTKSTTNRRDEFAIGLCP